MVLQKGVKNNIDMAKSNERDLKKMGTKKNTYTCTHNECLKYMTATCTSGGKKGRRKSMRILSNELISMDDRCGRYGKRKSLY